MVARRPVRRRSTQHEAKVLIARLPKHLYYEGHRERSNVTFTTRRRLLGAQRAPLRTAQGPGSHGALAETDHVRLPTARAESPIMS